MIEAKQQMDKSKKDADKLAGLVEDRFYWAELINELRRIFVAN